MAVFTLEDLGGAIEVMVFPKVMNEQGLKLADDALVLRARPRRRTRGRRRSSCASTSPCSRRSSDGAPHRCGFSVNPSVASEEMIDNLKRLLVEHPGRDAGVPAPRRAARCSGFRRSSRVDAGNGLAGEIRVLLGPDAIVA